MVDMLVVLALGNPGARYAATRHNIGWMVIDKVAERLRADFRPGKGEYYEAPVRHAGREALLVKPTTYMNNSGLAARQIAERHGVSPADILVVVDEIQFPTGRVRLKPSGSSGGHNGLESLIFHLETTGFPRLRCGVGKDFPSGGMADYVLSPFPSDEKEIVGEMIAEGCDAVLAWIELGTAKGMTRINTKEDPKEDPGTAKDTAPAANDATKDETTESTG